MTELRDHIMKEQLSKGYFARFFRRVLQGAWKEVQATIKVPLLVFSRDNVFHLDSEQEVSDFFSEFRALTQCSTSWKLRTEILEYREEDREMELYFVDVRLRGEGDFRKAKISAKFYVNRHGHTPRVEMIEFV